MLSTKFYNFKILNILIPGTVLPRWRIGACIPLYFRLSEHCALCQNM